MPTYEYECEACGHAFERFQSITAAPVKKCPECGKNKVKRLMGTGAGLIFKGKGFYITDYRSESYDKAAKAESGGNASSGGGDTPASGNGEAKPAAAASSSEGAAAKPAEAPKSAAKTEAKPAAKPSPSSAPKSKGR